MVITKDTNTRTHTHTHTHKQKLARDDVRKIGGVFLTNKFHRIHVYVGLHYSEVRYVSLLTLFWVKNATQLV